MLKTPATWYDWPLCLGLTFLCILLRLPAIQSFYYLLHRFLLYRFMNTFKNHPHLPVFHSHRHLLKARRPFPRLMTTSWPCLVAGGCARGRSSLAPVLIVDSRRSRKRSCRRTRTDADERISWLKRWLHSSDREAFVSRKGVQYHLFNAVTTCIDSSSPTSSCTLTIEAICRSSHYSSITAGLLPRCISIAFVIRTSV